MSLASTRVFWYQLRESKLTSKRGEVALERRRDIARKIVQGLAIAGL